MKSFKQFLKERYKSDHEDNIRQVASSARTEMSKIGRFGMDRLDPDFHGRRETYPTMPKRKNVGNRFMTFGDCDDTSSHCVRQLRKHYPSSYVAYGYKYTTKNVKTTRAPHSWVKIPEINHYADPSHDQFHDVKTTASRTDWHVPTVKGRYPNQAVRIGHMHHDDYKSEYKEDDGIRRSALRNKKQ